ncbi:unnamed protein product [Chrysodeixis includens]|uniref:Uncharacterized protein n=1 Tax=Chrysodeixis includens TaxID=689277 RepID=A0A9P0FRH0_CHRIL|nr:unnamed protein product [Chrysodeixis includens]
MSHLSEVLIAQSKLEETFSKRMAELEAQLHTSSAKDTVAKVAEEFRTFRELVFSMLGLLRQQIGDCIRSVDAMETRHRRKALLILGVAESESQDNTTVMEILQKKMALHQISSSSIGACHRIGARTDAHHRPILVWFSSVADRTVVWNAKTMLRGSSISMKEFLTRPRQLVFAKARQHFGMRACWTQDGIVIVKTAEGSRLKVATMDELESLISKHPKTVPVSAAVGASALTKRKD